MYSYTRLPTWYKMFSLKVTGAASFYRHVWCFWVWYWYRLAQCGPEKYRVNIFFFISDNRILKIYSQYCDLQVQLNLNSLRHRSLPSPVWQCLFLNLNEQHIWISFNSPLCSFQVASFFYIGAAVVGPCAALLSSHLGRKWTMVVTLSNTL